MLGMGSAPAPSDSSPPANITSTMQRVAEAGQYSDEVKSVLIDSAPILLQMIFKYGLPEMIFGFLRPSNDPLTSKYVYLFSPQPMIGTKD